MSIRLPESELSKFGGQLHRWQEFWDGHSSAVHENENLVKADKFKYLKSLLEEPVDANKYSRLGKLLMVTAYVLRFIRNVKSKKEGSEPSHGRLSVSEIRHADEDWMKQAQTTLKNNGNCEKSANQLNIVEMDGILVCKGRFENIDVPIESKYPIYLPKEHKLTELIILDCHNRSLIIVG